MRLSLTAPLCFIEVADPAKMVEAMISGTAEAERTTTAMEYRAVVCDKSESEKKNVSNLREKVKLIR